jgi:ATP-dependent DNA ligase
VNHLRVRSSLIDGEAVCCNQDGLSVFEMMRRPREGGRVFLYAFDLLELDGKDLRREPFEVRKATFASLLRWPAAIELLGEATVFDIVIQSVPRLVGGGW